MPNAVIVDAVRTGGGRGKKDSGKLSNWHPVDLAAEVLKALVERNNLDPALIDDVVMGCVMQVGEQGLELDQATHALLGRGGPPPCGHDQHACTLADCSTAAVGCGAVSSRLVLVSQGAPT